MKLQTKKLEIYLPLALIFSFLLYSLIEEYIRKDNWANLTLEKRYTIGTITDYVRAGKSPNTFTYVFSYQDKKIKASHLILSKIALLPEQKQKEFIGRRYFVKFIVKDPTYSKLIIKKKVPVDIKNAPLDGWVEIPH